MKAYSNDKQKVNGEKEEEEAAEEDPFHLFVRHHFEDKQVVEELRQHCFRPIIILLSGINCGQSYL